MSKQNDDQAPVSQDRFIASGLIGVSLLVLQVFLYTGLSDLSVTVSVIAFAVAIPMLAIFVLTITVAGPMPDSKRLDLLFYTGILAAAIGVAASFFHVSPLAGIIFVVSGIISVIIHATVIRQRRTEA